MDPSVYKWIRIATFKATAGVLIVWNSLFEHNELDSLNKILTLTNRVLRPPKVSSREWMCNNASLMDIFKWIRALICFYNLLDLFNRLFTKHNITEILVLKLILSSVGALLQGCSFHFKWMGSYDNQIKCSCRLERYVSISHTYPRHLHCC